jgi:predicted SprT family Zn-dependent metalloprotease
MTVETCSVQLGLWTRIREKIEELAGEQASGILAQLAPLPIKSSRATRSLGCYVSQAGAPVCIRLQFVQEPDNLRQTLLHEIAHVCDHLSRQAGQRYRQAHGPNWQHWARALGAKPERLGGSENLQRLYQQRLKLVAICQRCGAELHRPRRLNRRRRYLHVNCGGRLKSV